MNNQPVSLALHTGFHWSIVVRNKPAKPMGISVLMLKSCGFFYARRVLRQAARQELGA